MELLYKMFADLRLNFYEGTNKVLRAMTRTRFIKNIIRPSVFDKSNIRVRIAFGIIAQIIRMIMEFIKKLIYVLFLIYIPYRLISRVCPLVELHQELSIIYMFTVLSLICGSLANNTLLLLGDRDYMIVKVMLVSPYMNFLGRLFYKIVTEFIYFSIILCIFGVSPLNSILLCLATVSARPIGEMISLYCFEHLPIIYSRRNSYNGFIFALSTLMAYGLPLLNGKVSSEWRFATHPLFVVVMMTLGALSTYYLWSYKYYRRVMTHAMHIKREE